MEKRKNYIQENTGIFGKKNIIGCMFYFWAFFCTKYYFDFGTSPEVTEYVIKVLPVFLLGMAFLGISRAVISYFYATEKNTRAYILIYGESVLLAILLMILPRIIGVMGT